LRVAIERCFCDHIHMTAGSLLVRIDARSRVSLQHQIYCAIQRLILDVVLAPGSRLPASRTLASDLRISRTTTLLAYEQLIAEGYLSAVRGSGTFVASELPDDLPRAAPRKAITSRHPPLSRRGASRQNRSSVRCACQQPT
jgi:GntR family transcriptional regulator / MocR family aminotransferase